MLSSKSLKIKNKDSSLKNILNYSYRLLFFRPRSEKELYGRLKMHGFEDGLIQNAIFNLKEARLLNDKEFAEKYIESKSALKGFGPKRLKYDLKRLGVPDKNIDENLKSFRENFKNSAKRLMEKKIGSLKETNKYKAKQKVFSYLMQKGYDMDLINELFSEINLDE